MIGTYDIEAAKLVWRNKISSARTAAFEKNDLAIRDAQLANDKVALKAAISRRDELRAIGDKIDAATDIESLKKIVIE